MERRKFILASAAAGGAFALGKNAVAADGEEAFFSLPVLTYAYDALVPHIDAQTMEIHHGKHHAGYISKFNAALSQIPGAAGSSVESILGNLGDVADAGVKMSLRNNGGGYYNHKLFWEIMAPPSETGKASGSLSKAIEQKFGSMKQFQEEFAAAAANQFGSGWAWLVVRDGNLFVTSTPNQDNPLMRGIVAEEELGTPILGVDVWEHAYYLNYQNRRGDYLNAWWNVVNWDQVSQSFDRA